jgi:ribonuclease HI
MDPTAARDGENVDAAIGKNNGCGSLAAIARSDAGVFMGASAVVFPGKTDAETLEALACREAVFLAFDINTRSIYVASDRQIVIQNLEKGTMGVCSHIVREITESRRKFQDLVFKYEREVSNKEAHCLARSVVVDAPGRQVWLITPPEGLCIFTIKWELVV